LISSRGRPSSVLTQPVPLSGIYLTDEYKTMTFFQQVLFGRVRQSHILIIVAALSELWTDSLYLTVSAFPSISTGKKPTHSIFSRALHRRHRTHADITGTRLLAHDRQIKIRDWRTTDEEPKKIHDFLSRWKREEKKDFYDPEGPIASDASNERTLRNSYSEDDGGCFLVAVDGESGEGKGAEIVGTLGMISGTQVSYLSSGTSIARPEISAAVRRVCASRTEDTEDASADEEFTGGSSATKILEALLREGERRAVRAGATKLIGLAYSNGHDESMNIVKPTGSLFESLGYRAAEQQMPGVKTIQYEKKLSADLLLSENTDGIVSATKTDRIAEWVIPASVTTLILFVLLVFNLYSNVFGIEQIWGSIDNGGIGTSLSTENLEELMRNEKLGRSGLDDRIGSSVAARQWEDLSPEELREEQALMKVIQGQSIRPK